MPDIFLSYVREDKEQAQRLAQALERQGWCVFWDRSSIHIGEDLDEVIENAIEQCRCMIVGWSRLAKKSDWVRGEATIGRERRILLPLKFETVEPPIAFRSLHTEDFSDWRGEEASSEFQALCKSVRRLLGEPAQFSPPAADLAKAVETSPPLIQANRLVTEPEMIIIPAGSFAMGGDQYDNEKPIHTVTFAKPFKLGKYPVMFVEYDVFAEQTGRAKPEDLGWGRGRRPVINVTWQDAADYAAWLRETTGKPYRLPSEAEWEYACRAGSRGEFFWGDDAGLAKHYAWFDQNAGGTIQEVGLKLANPYGLHDMVGNVWEWLQDGWYEDYQGAPIDGSAWIGGYGGRRVIRSGSWGNSMASLRSAHRLWNSPEYRFNFLGFRLALDLP
ncbi:hypothetical protein BJL95_06345 [Methylomonas sp. LWB]|uniref:SUMF1/EgtB/PvdO family nonheme iron enzyme n=1 Tax=Methylomonas sp. LWB TaxID=1905845 RepID=UPI0008DADE43|nr:SUMF1/EgtB/PvdO family nonheme iron enzyme [Methylomonas sp. LWB]OHX34104.1 hypothetical protein BJL95_06345 [Methylomonas sp. LWB]